LFQNIVHFATQLKILPALFCSVDVKAGESLQEMKPGGGVSEQNTEENI
jgi:hypothetical protein